MDRVDNSREELEAALASIRRVNRWLGGRNALVQALEPWLRDPPKGRPLRLLDIGTGDADIPLAVAREAAKRGIELQIVAIELDPATAAIARDHVASECSIKIVRADALALPFADGSFDLVTASLFLHHFHELEVVRLLHSFARVASGAVVINDLHRHRLPYWFIRAVCLLLRPDPMFANDAPLSVLRGFTVDELAWAAHQATRAPVRLRRRWPFRLVLELHTSQIATHPRREILR